MEDQNKNAKRRERIKTILIIFLTLMLILTFFSNTIMNHSLPTVSAQYASYGTINEKVRGSGFVAANQNYEIIAEGNRTVSKVNIKQGDTVKIGDPLFILEAEDGDESLKMAEAEIEELELAYQKALLTIAPTYARENQEIAAAQQALQDAINRLNQARSSSGNTGISAAQYSQASSDAQKAAEQAAALSGYISMLSSGETTGIPVQYTAGMQSAKGAYDAAAAVLASANADLELRTSALTITSAEQQAEIQSLERIAETANIAYQRAIADYNASGGDLELQRAMEDAGQTAKYAEEDVTNAKTLLTSIQAQEAAIETARTAVSEAEAAVDSASQTLNDAIGTAIAMIQGDLDAANTRADEAAAIMNAYQAQSGSDMGMDITSLEEAVTMQQQTLQGLIVALAETKQNDNLTQQQEQLDLQSQQKTIERKKEELEKLRKNSGTVTLTSKNAGVVSIVSYAAGDEVMDGAVLAQITLTDAGYTVQFRATAEQARKVTVGAIADVTNAGYREDISAKLVSSKADIENPASTDRILTFDITGKDVTPGQMVALSISCSSQSYDCVVPSSAIMEDKDGKFVLVMESKSTPLGNRYYASRANITILAADEVNSAVQGDVNFSDFIITASEKPLTPGMQVRMEE